MADKVISIANTITVGELAETLNLSVTALVGELFKNGIVATINQKLDFETVAIIIEELGIDATLERKATSSDAGSASGHELSENAVARPPIVAVMGHVDHGKTTLLDTIIGQTKVEDEAGSITQHISAYQVERNGRLITLLDTPGHEAFAALRQHGAALTDVVVIVVAADDGVKPQTVEAIRFARNAHARIVVAINKMDKETANPQLVKTQLASEHNLNPEEWGGDTVMVEVSAKTGKGVDELLDMVLLVSDIDEPKADINTPAEGIVIEGHMETGRGSVVGLLIEHGELRPAHFLVAGSVYGKVRTLLDFKGDTIKVANPSTPVTITGFKELPQFGDTFKVVKSEKEARHLAALAKQNAENSAASSNVTGSDILKLMSQERESQHFNVIIKADVQGSLTAIIDSLKLVDTGGEVTLHVVASGIGNISENDVYLAAGDTTIIYGFNVELPSSVKRLAARQDTPVRIYNVIYELLDDARIAMEETLSPEVVETEVGRLKIKGVFRTVRDEVIAGGEVLNGKAAPDTLARIMRQKEQIAEVEVISIQKEQSAIKEAFEGELCGISLRTQKKLLLKEGDVLELFTRELKKRTIKG